MKFDVRGMMSEKDSRHLRKGRAHPTSTINNQQSNIPTGISLVEILISIFVLLFGLMGVASIFPVGNHYVIEAEKFDLGSSLSQNAFEELGCRGLLRPEFWHYADPEGNLSGETASSQNPPDEFDTSFIQPSTLSGAFNINAGQFNIPGAVGPGHAFVIDPLGTATSILPNPTLPNLDFFPYNSGRFPYYSDGSGNTNPWFSGVPVALSGTRWPLRRLTIQDTIDLMSTRVAETIFTLRDDLVVDQPKKSDRPSIQTWDIDSKGTLTPNDDTFLRRQFKGDYNWLATVVPTTVQARDALQPGDPASAYSNYRYDISVVVFRKRETTPSATSERLITAELEQDGNLVIYASSSEIVDAALEDVRPGNWIALTGVNQTTGVFMMKWYRLLAMDTENLRPNSPGNSSSNFIRRAMLDGPTWPSHSFFDLRAVILPGAIGVTTQELTMEDGSLRSYD